MDSSFSIPAHHQSIDRANLGTLNSNVKVQLMGGKQLEEKFQALFAEGKASPPDKRGKINNALGRLLWNHRDSLAQSRFNSSCFEEGYFRLMTHFWSNVWEIEPNSKTESAYCDSDKIVNRLRLALRCKIIDAQNDQRGKHRRGQLPNQSLDARIGHGDDNGYSLLDRLAAPKRTNEYDDLIKTVQEDVNGEFSGTKMRIQPHINARNSLQLYFKLENWKEVANELGADNIASFNSFRTDRIEPLITRFWGLWELVDLDITGELHRTVMEDYPQVNAQRVLRLTLRGTRTSYIAKQLGIEKTTLLMAFINLKCLPLLKGLST